MVLDTLASLGVKYRGSRTHRWRLSSVASSTTLAKLVTIIPVDLGYWRQHVTKEMIAHLMTNVNHYEVNNNAVLNSVGLSGGLAWLQNRQVTMANLSLRQLTYHEDENRRGTLMSLKGSHWYVLGKTGRRIEPWSIGVFER